GCCRVPAWTGQPTRCARAPWARGSGPSRGGRSSCASWTLPCRMFLLQTLSSRALEPRGLPQRGRAIGALPAELGLRAAEVPVCSGLLVDRPQQIELADDRR